MATVGIPRVTNSVDQRFLIEPLSGATQPSSYLSRFPDAIYNTSIDSHLVRFLYALLGPAGVGGNRRNYLQARLIFEAHGLELFDLDHFYGNPFQFGRIADEVYQEDVRGLLPQDEWERIRSKDARYRNRIIDFISGARAGGTPLGMRLVARSGLGHEAEIIENYRHLFDQNSDDSLELKHHGRTRHLNEMVVLPRQEAPRSEIQKIAFLGEPTGGTFRLFQAGSPRQTPPLPHDASNLALSLALEDVFQTEQGSVVVEGGPLPFTPVLIRFARNLAAQNLGQIESINELTGTDPQIVITTSQQGFDPASESLHIPPRDQRNLQEALDRIRPVSVIPTFAAAPGIKSKAPWIHATASSEFDEMVRYVTGSGNIYWPNRDSVHWIEAGREHQAPRAHAELPYTYAAFHQISQIASYNTSALAVPSYLTPDWWTKDAKNRTSDHSGPFDKTHALLFPPLKNLDQEFTADQAIADYPEPLTVERTVEDRDGATIGLINGIYPNDYLSLSGVPAPRYTADQWWSSREIAEGDEYLEVDLGDVVAVRYISFEVTRKPVSVEISYDTLGMDTAYRNFITANKGTGNVYFSAAEPNPWIALRFFPTNGRDEMIYTRFVRIKFSRRSQEGFLSRKIPWSVDVKNLRIGRVVTNQ